MSLRPDQYEKDYVPVQLRGEKVLRLDLKRRVWTVLGEDIVKLQPCYVPYRLCGLPVIVTLPSSPIRGPRREISVGTSPHLDLSNGMSVKDARELWEFFPFATAFCIWMNGHVQLLAPSLTDAEISQLVVPARFGGLEVSISRWSPGPTASADIPWSQATETQVYHNSMAIVSQIGTAGQQSCKNGIAPSGRPGQAKQSSAAVQGASMSQYQTPPHMENPLPFQNPDDMISPVQVHKIDGQISHPKVPALANSNQAPVTNSVLPTQSQTNCTLPGALPWTLDVGSRIKLGNTTSSADVKMKASSGAQAGHVFLSTSTHAVFEGVTGRKLRTRIAPKKRSRWMKPIRDVFGIEPDVRAISIAGIGVHDLKGRIVGSHAKWMEIRTIGDKGSKTNPLDRGNRWGPDI